MDQWVVSVKHPSGRRERTRVTSVVVDREPTLEELRSTIGEVARLLVDSLYVQHHTHKPQELGWTESEQPKVRRHDPDPARGSEGK